MDVREGPLVLSLYCIEVREEVLVLDSLFLGERWGVIGLCGMGR